MLYKKTLKMVSNEDALCLETARVGDRDGKRNTLTTKYMRVEKFLV